MRPNLRKPFAGHTNTPGDFASMEALHEWNIKRKYAVGFDFDTKVGTQTFPGISFPGTARMMLGFVVFDDTGDPKNKFTLTINNEQIVTNASWGDYSKMRGLSTTVTDVGGSNYKDEYFVYPRALSGNDGVVLQYDVASAGHFWILFFYKSIVDIIT
jgi:hypothetical protein